MKNKFLWHISGIALGLVLSLGACAGSPEAGTAAVSAETPAPAGKPGGSGGRLPSIRITNNTGYTVYFVYVSQADSESWGDDMLGDDVLMNGDSVNITLSRPLSEVSVYDIKLEDKEGDTYTKWDVPVSAGGQIEFTLKDIDMGDIITSDTQNNRDMPAVLIVNNTGYTVYFVYVSQTARDKWGPDQLSDSQVLRDRDTFLCYLPYPLDVVNRYDIKLEDEDGDTYTKMDVLIRANSRVVFTIADLDLD
ncbi:MAG: hypothetical protein LBP32_07860 [Spirochaetaceae bacterium]|jgi:hypothetical protein|nr:hypothetical protein [Spirochaetaceae bacterium]